MLSLLVLLKFSKFKGLSTAQLASFAKLLVLPTSITLLVFDHHWLPISSRVQYKIALICFHHTSPSCFISTLFLALFAQSRIFRGPRMGRRTLGDRSFQRIGPVIWNSLPLWQAFVFTLSSKLQLKPTSSLVHTDLVVAFFLFILSAQHY